MTTLKSAIIITPAVPSDLDTIMQLVDASRETMRQNGNFHQWPEGYPRRETFAADIRQGHCYVCRQGGRIIGSFSMIPGPDPTYAVIKDGQWIDDSLPYHVIHRITSAAGSHGVFAALNRWAFSQCDNVRIDTHRDNTIMQHCLLRHGYQYCGIIFLANGEERLAYQKIEK